MEEPPEQVVTEEPLPGWLRYEISGRKPFPRTVMRTTTMLTDFLKKEHASGRMLEVTGAEFSFKRRLGLKEKAGSSFEQSEAGLPNNNTVKAVASQTEYEHRSVVNLLTRDTDKLVDHKMLLSKTSKQLDEVRPKDPYQSPESFENMKIKLSTAGDMREIVAI